MRRPKDPNDMFGGQATLLEKDTVLGEVAAFLDLAPEVLRERIEQLTTDQICALVAPFAEAMAFPVEQIASILRHTVGAPTLAPKLDDDIN